MVAALSPISVCSGDAFSAPIALTSTVANSVIGWTSVATGVTGSAGSGTGATSIDETLTASGTSQGTVVYTVKSVGPAPTNCASAVPDKTVTVTVNPKPKLTTALSAGMCSEDGTLNIALTSDVTTPSFSWTAASTGASAVTGLTAGPSTASSITDNLSIATSIVAGEVTYTVVTSKAGCSTTSAIKVAVGARPSLTVPVKSATICSGTSANLAVSTSFPTTISWITPVATQSITGGAAYTSAANEAATNINQVLTNPNATGNPGTVTYLVVAGTTGCQSPTETVVITVDKCPVTADFTVDDPNVCDGAATVIYTDNSSLTANDWVWTFTNGTPASAIGPGPHSVTYAPGTPLGAQSVTLLVQDKTKLPLVVTNTKTLSLTTINAIPVITNTAPEQAVTICSGSKTGFLLKSDQTNTVFTWVAPTVSGAITGSSAGTSTAPSPTIDQALSITGTSAGTVTYVVTPDLAGCIGSPINYVATVEPIPVISPLSAVDICSGIVFNQTISADVPNSTIAWTRASVTNILPATGSGSNGTVSETLSNTGNTVAAVSYVFTPSGPASKNCVGKPVTLTLNVAPKPVISNTVLTGTVCSNDAFNYTATSNVANASFAWTRAVGTNVTNAAASGNTSAISETLTNTSTQVGSAQYVITPTGPAPTSCAGTPSTVDVTVNPLPVITSANTAITCSNAPFTYTITTGLATSPTFKWTRAQSGVNAANSGTTNASFTETLISATSTVITYKLNATTAAGCTNVLDAPLDVTVAPLPTGKLTIAPQVCDGDSPVLTATITGSAPFDYVISGGGMSPETVTASSLNITTRNVTPGAGTATYAITNLKDATGCTSVSMSGISTQVNPLPEAVISYDQQICQGTSAKLGFDLSSGTANYNVTYKYYPVTSPGTITTVPINNLTSLSDTLLVSPSSSTVYKIVAVTDSKGCKAIIDPLNEAIITVIPRPNVVPSALSTIICSGGFPNVSLASTAVGTETGTSFKWVVTNPPSKVSGFTNPGAGVTILDVIKNASGRDATVKYNITPTFLSCDGAAVDVLVKVRAETEPVLADLIDICPNTAIELKTNSFPVGGGASYIWTVDPPVTTTSDRDTLALTLDQDEIVQVTYIDACGVAHPSAPVALKVKQEVTITYKHGDSCMASVTPFWPINLSDASNVTVIDGWKWNFGNYIIAGDSALSTKMHPETTFQYNVAGTYDVTLKAMSEGCEVGKTVVPIIIKDCTVEVTNTITPNDDKSNDEWIIKEIENYPTASVEIFNRWGVLIWSCQGDCASKRFSGRNEQGQELEQGTYYYVLTLNKGKSIMRGYITIIRDPGN